MPEPTSIAPARTPAPATAKAVPQRLLCVACFGPLDWVLEPEKARQNPLRVHCQNPQCKQSGRIYRVPTIKLVAE